ncbi:hypothetical protein AAFF_G00227220 [Aldrovandia affinis]|uniref:Uncharacterized protein n=1 Tax=Aldrovandia affinis TaxID=143900 RepID=A0AAD7TBF7_9TELE|nr:hypothetical protein AAFF_G00227220 [Aldrovandia affinis]
MSGYWRRMKFSTGEERGALTVYAPRGCPQEGQRIRPPVSVSGRPEDWASVLLCLAASQPGENRGLVYPGPAETVPPGPGLLPAYRGPEIRQPGWQRHRAGGGVV